MTDIERMLSGNTEDMAWRLRAAMFLADITARELSEKAMLSAATMSYARNPRGRNVVSYATYRKIFWTIKDNWPVAIRMVIAAERARKED